jgi:hypothetical protein
MNRVVTVWCLALAACSADLSDLPALARSSGTASSW